MAKEGNDPGTSKTSDKLRTPEIRKKGIAYPDNKPVPTKVDVPPDSPKK